MNPVSLPSTSHEWLIDSNSNIALAIRHTGQPLFQEQSPYQKVEVYDTFEYGKMLTVDSLVMCTERDEYAYHEMIVHVPMLTHGAVRQALIIGGGDGGTAREMLRHDEIEAVTMVEIDEAVVRASRLHLPTLSVAFDHPKFNLIIGDGIEFIAQSPDAAFDLIVIDSSDPVGPAKGLFNPEFYQQVHRCLRPGGVMTVQSESPHFNRAACVELHQCLKSIFGADRVHCYLAFIPTYPTGMWSFNYCSKQGPHPTQGFDRAQADRFVQIHNLQYYNAEVHAAAFCLPTFIQKMLGQ